MKNSSSSPSSRNPTRAFQHARACRDKLALSLRCSQCSLTFCLLTQIYFRSLFYLSYPLHEVSFGSFCFDCIKRVPPSPSLSFRHSLAPFLREFPALSSPPSPYPGPPVIYGAKYLLRDVLPSSVPCCSRSLLPRARKLARRNQPLFPFSRSPAFLSCYPSVFLFVLTRSRILV